MEVPRPELEAQGAKDILDAAVDLLHKVNAYVSQRIQKL